MNCCPYRHWHSECIASHKGRGSGYIVGRKGTDVADALPGVRAQTWWVHCLRTALQTAGKLQAQGAQLRVVTVLGYRHCQSIKKAGVQLKLLISTGSVGHGQSNTDRNDKARIRSPKEAHNTGKIQAMVTSPSLSLHRLMKRVNTAHHISYCCKTQDELQINRPSVG